MQRDPAPVTKAIPLSNDSVARRIWEMSTDTEEQLCAKLRGCPFSVQLDETTTADNNVLLMAYVSYVFGRDLVKDFLFGEYLTTDTRGETIFAALTKGALTLGPRPRARAHLHTKVRNGLASVSTPSVFQHGTGPWPRHTWERCAMAKVQMLMR